MKYCSDSQVWLLYNCTTIKQLWLLACFVSELSVAWSPWPFDLLIRNNTMSYWLYALNLDSAGLPHCWVRAKCQTKGNMLIMWLSPYNFASPQYMVIYEPIFSPGLLFILFIYYMIYIAPISRIESEALASLGGEHDSPGRVKR